MSDLQQNLTYEEALRALQAIVKDLESGNISMDQLEAQVRKANDLVKYCDHKLRVIEQRLDDAKDKTNEADLDPF